MQNYKKLFWLFPLFVFILLIGCLGKKEGSYQTEMEEQDGLQKAMDQEFLMTRDPALGYVPKERLLLAQQNLARLMGNAPNRLGAISWQERGPNNVAGRSRAVLIDQRDPTGNTVFAASVSGGIWKATNFKSTPTWTPVAENMGSIAVCALAQDPSNTSVMYAGTGEGWFNSDAVRGNGIWKSTDGGSTWNHLTSTDSTINSHNFDYIQDIVVNANGIVFASSRPSLYCNRGGILRSADGGTTWARVIGSLKPGATTCSDAYNYYGADLELGSNGDIYATTGYTNQGTSDSANFGRIWRSTSDNAGTSGTWTDITPSGNVWERIEIACAPSSAGTIYALLQKTGVNGIGAIKKSTDFGATWTDLPLPSWCSQGTTSSDFTNGQAWYDLIAAVDPTNSNTVVIGGIDLHKSTDGGATWNQLTRWSSFGNCASLPVIHADQHNVVFFPNSSSEFIATNDGGVFYTNNGGSTFATATAPNLNGANQTTYSLKNIGFNVTQFYSCAIHPTKTNYFLAGAQDNGTQQFTTAGINTTTEASVGGDGGFAHIDQTDGNIQVASYVYNNFFYSKNNGLSFSKLDANNNGRFINPSDYDNGTKFLYTSNSPGQMGQLNLSGSGTPAFNTVTISGIGTDHTISAVKVDPTVSGGGVAWLASSTSPDATTSVVPNLVKITNASSAAPNTAFSKTLSFLPAGAYVSSIDVDPANASHLVLTASNYGVASVWESSDGGSSWASLDNNSVNLPDIPVRWGMFLPANLSVNGTTGSGILIGTEIGVYYAAQSAGTATTWAIQNNGLPNVRVDMLKYRSSDGLLAAATHGRGLFTTNLTMLTTGITPVPNTSGFIRYISSENNNLSVVVGSLNLQKMQMEILDMNGRLLYTTTRAYQATTLNTANLSKGVYILRIYGNRNEYFAQRFVKK